MKQGIVVACVLLAVCILVGFRGSDQSTPQATIKAFCAAVQSADYKGAARMVKGGLPDGDFVKLAASLSMKGVKWMMKAENLKVAFQRDTATATFTLLTSMQGKEQPSRQETLPLERIGGVWLIVPPPSLAPKTPLGSVVYALSHPMERPMPGQPVAVGPAQDGGCFSNVKQLCFDFMVFLADSDDLFKFKADTWKKALAPYVKSEKLFHCPDDPSGSASYSVNPYLAGKYASEIAAPSRTVLVYEGHNMKLDFRHGGKACVGFVDGDASMVTPAQAKKLRWKP